MCCLYHHRFTDVITQRQRPRVSSCSDSFTYARVEQKAHAIHIALLSRERGRESMAGNNSFFTVITASQIRAPPQRFSSPNGIGQGAPPHSNTAKTQRYFKKWKGPITCTNSRQGLKGADDTICFMWQSSHQNLTCFCEISSQKTRNVKWKAGLSPHSFLQEAFGCPAVCDFSPHASCTHLSAAWLEASLLLRPLTPATFPRAWKCWDLKLRYQALHKYFLNKCHSMNAWIDHLGYFKIMITYNYMKFAVPEMGYRLKIKII